MTAWEAFLLDVLKVVVIVWLIGTGLFLAAFAPSYFRGRR